MIHLSCSGCGGHVQLPADGNLEHSTAALMRFQREHAICALRGDRCPPYTATIGYLQDALDVMTDEGLDEPLCLRIGRHLDSLTADACAPASTQGSDGFTP